MTQHSPNSSNSSQCTTCVSYQVTKAPIQGKMLIYFITNIGLSLCKAFTIDVMPKLKKNVLNFGYGANFKYEGMLTHSFDRFYVVAEYEIPKVEHLQFNAFTFDLMCNHLNISKSPLLRYIKHCRRIAPYVKFYKQQIDYYNWMAYELLQNKTGLILPNLKNRKKRFLNTILGTIATKVVNLAFEGISSFLHQKWYEALQKAVNVLHSRKGIDHNSVYHLEDTMIMYGKYNSDTLMELINMVHQMQNVTTWKEQIFVSEMNNWLKYKLGNIHSEFDYSMDAVLFLTTIKEKYVRMYEKFINELRSYSKAVRILSKGYLPTSLITPSKLEAILWQVQAAIIKSNQDYEIVLNRPYLYYNMNLVKFGIDYQKNLIIQFPVFVQLYTQTKLTLYQVETVPVPIVDSSNKVQSYTQLKIEKPYIALNDEMCITIHPQELSTCKRISYEYFCEERFVVKSKHQ